jgi:hypothetical protein
LFDIASGVAVQEELAHEKELWSLSMLPDKVALHALFSAWKVTTVFAFLFFFWKEIFHVAKFSFLYLIVCRG